MDEPWNDSNLSTRTSIPVTAPGFVRNRSFAVSPTWTVRAGAARPRARSAEATPAMTGRFAMANPARFHMLSRLGTIPNFGVTGQKIPRGKTTSANGRTPMPKIIAIAIPTSPAIPRRRLPSTWANVSTAITMRTVPPDARIAPAVPRTALAIASDRFSVLMSSSR